MNTWKENNTLRRIKEYYDEVNDENYGDDYDDDYSFPETERYPISHGYFVVAITEDDLNFLKSDDIKKQKDALTRAYIIDAYIEDHYGDYWVSPLSEGIEGEESRKRAINWFNTEFAQEVTNTKPSKDWKFVLLYIEDEDLLAGLTWTYDYYDICVARQTYWDPAEYETEVIEDSIRMYKGDCDIAGYGIGPKYLLEEFKELKDKETLETYTITVLEDDSWVEDERYQVNFKIIEELPR